MPGCPSGLKPVVNSMSSVGKQIIYTLQITCTYILQRLDIKYISVSDRRFFINLKKCTDQSGRVW